MTIREGKEQPVCAIGTYDLEKHRFIPDDPILDIRLSLYYASKYFYDPLKHKIILWVNNTI